MNLLRRLGHFSQVSDLYVRSIEEATDVSEKSSYACRFARYLAKVCCICLAVAVCGSVLPYKAVGALFGFECSTDSKVISITVIFQYSGVHSYYSHT